jgi:hypothetical protein
LDGKQWGIADPQRKSLMKETSNYIAMQVIADTARNPMAGFQRFRFIVKPEGENGRMSSLHQVHMKTAHARHGKSKHS